MFYFYYLINNRADLINFYIQISRRLHELNLMEHILLILAPMIIDNLKNMSPQQMEQYKSYVHQVIAQTFNLPLKPVQYQPPAPPQLPAPKAPLLYSQIDPNLSTEKFLNLCQSYEEKFTQAQKEVRTFLYDRFELLVQKTSQKFKIPLNDDDSEISIIANYMCDIYFKEVKDLQSLAAFISNIDYIRKMFFKYRDPLRPDSEVTSIISFHTRMVNSQLKLFCKLNLDLNNQVLLNILHQWVMSSIQKKEQLIKEQAIANAVKQPKIQNQK